MRIDAAAETGVKTRAASREPPRVQRILREEKRRLRGLVEPRGVRHVAAPRGNTAQVGREKTRPFTEERSEERRLRVPARVRHRKR
eukprot:scaffold9088_cov118-Isochrysis_galbana.AAC.4